MNNNSQNHLAAQGQINQGYGVQGYGVQKDPSVSSAEDAVTALKKRANELRQILGRVDSQKAELDTIERMIAASAVAK